MRRGRSLTDLEKALAEGGQPVETDLSRALAEGGTPVDAEAAAAPAAPRSFLDRASFAIHYPVESLKEEAGLVKEAAKAAPGQLADIFSNFGHTIATAGKGALNLVSPISGNGEFHVPLGQLVDAPYRRELERGVSDTVTAGLAEKGANAISHAVHEKFPSQVGDFQTTAASDAVAAPEARTLGQVAGMGLESPFTRLAEGVGGVVPGTGPLADTARGVAGYEAAAVPQAAIQAAANAPEGHRLEAAGHAALATATDPASLVAAGGIPAVTSFLRRKLDVAAARAPEVQEAAKQRAVKDLGKDITSAEGVKSRVTDQKRIAEVNDRLYDLADKNPELRQAFSEPAEKALPKIQEFKEQLAQPLDRLYDAIDEKTGGGLDPRQVVGELRRMSKDARTPGIAKAPVGGLADSDRLGKLADQFEQVYVTEREPAAPAEPSEPATQPHGVGSPPLHGGAEPEFDTSDGGYYHVGLKPIDRIGPDLSLAESPEEAIPYINGNKGVIHRIDLDPGAKIAGEKAIREAANDLGIEKGYVFEMADNPRVRASLKEDGYDAIKYTDMGPDNSYEHETVRLLNPDAAKITARGSVANGEIADPVRESAARGASSRADLAGALDQLRKLRENAKGVAAKGLDEQIAKLEGEMPATAPTAGIQKIPTRVFRHEVTELLKKSDSVMGGIEGTPRFEALQKLYDAGKQIIDKHIDGSGLPPDQIAQLRDINNGYFLLSRAEGAIESRGFKEANKPGYKFPTSVKAAAHSGGLAGIATAAALGGPHAVVHALPYVIGTELAAHALPAVAKSLNWQLAHGAYTRGVQRLIDLARKVPRAEFLGAAARVVGADGARRIYDAAQKPAAVYPASAPPNQDITL